MGEHKRRRRRRHVIAVLSPAADVMATVCRAIKDFNKSEPKPKPVIESESVSGQEPQS